ncbi:response regulator transcription factor [Ruminiclostridium cellulolyticum]|uniref:Stage 0 sporulation protein A homolog n=1 Tax=Ruminiclostridium cellulolyticum (strain ATCC 35319 / DSM 5812 / JCM 6584 / H10) TaxID=394503 RepID=B8I717_RUMCH|nr:response regulator transcription factor [Ruminiclostridium cellulolyticum]ACL74941.1 two component transcriptional regulator, winged helix family [Ruminiclostridium cellulolyticum H10]
MARILIVEDDKLLNEGISIVLKKHGHTVLSGYSYNEALCLFLNNNFELILLDINLPDRSGLELCNEIRKKSDVPIIFITANDTEQDIVNGFVNGCDDYIAKPFSLEVMNRRIQAVLRRTGTEDKSIFRSGEISINYEKMVVSKGKISLKLTATEYKLLTLLTQNSGQVLTRDIILQRLWGTDEAFVDENAVSVNMRRLRQKIEDDPKNPKYIKTVFGIGYTWGEESCR